MQEIQTVSQGYSKQMFHLFGNLCNSCQYLFKQYFIRQNLYMAITSMYHHVYWESPRSLETNFGSVDWFPNYYSHTNNSTLEYTLQYIGNQVVDISVQSSLFSQFPWEKKKNCVMQPCLLHIGCKITTQVSLLTIWEFFHYNILQARV